MTSLKIPAELTAVNRSRLSSGPACLRVLGDGSGRVQFGRSLLYFEKRQQKSGRGGPLAQVVM
jgi:hypothetical protein